MTIKSNEAKAGQGNQYGHEIQNELICQLTFCI